MRDHVAECAPKPVKGLVREIVRVVELDIEERSGVPPRSSRALTNPSHIRRLLVPGFCERLAFYVPQLVRSRR
jgi:hypothetical protein